MVFALALSWGSQEGHRYLGGLSRDLRSPDFVSLLLLTSGVWQESTSTHAHPSKSRSDWRLHISCALALRQCVSTSCVCPRQAGQNNSLYCLSIV